MCALDTDRFPTVAQTDPGKVTDTVRCARCGKRLSKALACWRLAHTGEVVCANPSQPEYDLAQLGALVDEARGMADDIARDVDAIRAAGGSWAAIAAALGVSRQAAQQRFGPARARATSTSRPS